MINIFTEYLMIANPVRQPKCYRQAKCDNSGCWTINKSTTRGNAILMPNKLSSDNLLIICQSLQCVSRYIQQEVDIYNAHLLPETS